MHYTCRNLTDADIIALASLAVLQPSRLEALQSLNLSHNMIGDAGASALGRALGTGAPALERLMLHENRIGDEGMVGLTMGMRPGGASVITDMRLNFVRRLEQNEAPFAPLRPPVAQSTAFAKPTASCVHKACMRPACLRFPCARALPLMLGRSTHASRSRAEPHR